MNAPNQTRSNDSQGWEPCATGELGGLATRLQTAERRRRQVATVKVAGISSAMAAAVVLVAGLVVAQPDRVAPGGEMIVGGIACSECIAGMNGYHQHLTAGAELKDPTIEQMAAHLEGCKACRRKFEMMFPGVLDQANSASEVAARLYYLDSNALLMANSAIH